jgi:hypothetical protein
VSGNFASDLNLEGNVITGWLSGGVPGRNYVIQIEALTESDPPRRFEWPVERLPDRRHPPDSALRTGTGWNPHSKFAHGDAPQTADYADPPVLPGSAGRVGLLHVQKIGRRAATPTSGPNALTCMNATRTVPIHGH